MLNQKTNNHLLSIPLYYLKGFKLLFKQGYKRFALIPILLNILCFMAIFGMGFKAIHQIQSHLSSPEWMPAWGESLFAVFAWIIQWVLALLLFLVVALVANLSACLICAPFCSFLVEKLIQDQPQIKVQRTTENQWWRSLAQTLKRELEKAWYVLPRFLLYSLFIFIVAFIPLLQFISAFLMIILSAWMLSLQYIDLSIEALGLPFSETKKLCQNNLFNCIIFGSFSLIFSLIPLIQWLCIPSTAIAATWLTLGLMSEKPSFQSVEKQS
jgi:CysZ protein